MIHFDINEVGNLSLFFAPFYSLPEYGITANLGTIFIKIWELVKENTRDTELGKWFTNISRLSSLKSISRSVIWNV